MPAISALAATLIKGHEVTSQSTLVRRVAFGPRYADCHRRLCDSGASEADGLDFNFIRVEPTT